ncbi:hypothetical protein V6248_09945 [Pseudoalteromonas agarivorans]|uniref:hypothetical protein n=1 Tax=Pseudoalteromonas agarivorans TaxID=176102 RepID=UPI00311D5DDF
MLKSVDKLVVADEMLEASIDEFLDNKRFFSSINLAGVAEEIYGKYVRTTGQRDVQHDLVEDAIKMSVKQGGPKLDVKEVKEMKKVANHDKNAIKHFDSSSDRYIEINEENEARLAIATAIENHKRADRPNLIAIDRFRKFATEYVAQK